MGRVNGVDVDARRLGGPYKACLIGWRHTTRVWVYACYKRQLRSLAIAGSNLTGVDNGCNPRRGGHPGSPCKHRALSMRRMPPTQTRCECCLVSLRNRRPWYVKCTHYTIATRLLARRAQGLRAPASRTRSEYGCAYKPARRPRCGDPVVHYRNSVPFARYSGRAQQGGAPRPLA